MSEYNNIYIIHNGNGDIEYKGNNRYTLQTNDKLSTLRFDVKKKLNEAMKDSNTNGLSLDSMGHMARANNDEDLGKMYDPKRIAFQAALKTESERPSKAAIAAKYGVTAIESSAEYPPPPED